MLKFELVPTEKLILGQQIRQHPPEYLRRLHDSLRQGQLQPIGCLHDFTVTYGFGRVLAARLEPVIPDLYAAVTDKKISEREVLRQRAVENFVRSDATNAEKCRIAIEYAHSEPSLTLKQIAADLGVDPAMITKWRSYENCIEAVQQALADGKITLNTMYDLSKLPQEEQGAALVNYLNPTKGGRKLNGSSISRFKCALSNCTVSLAYQDDSADMESIIETLAELLKSARKHKDQNLDAKTWERVLKDKAAAN